MYVYLLKENISNDARKIVNETMKTILILVDNIRISFFGISKVTFTNSHCTNNYHLLS